MQVESYTKSPSSPQRTPGPPSASTAPSCCLGAAWASSRRRRATAAETRRRFPAKPPGWSAGGWPPALPRTRWASSGTAKIQLNFNPFLVFLSYAQYILLDFCSIINFLQFLFSQNIFMFFQNAVNFFYNFELIFFFFYYLNLKAP